jgi:hypothetical protein
MKRITFKKDILVILIIIVSPIAFYHYMLAPSNAQIWEIGFFSINADYYERARDFLWISAYKILIVTLISVWFITCKYWWRYFLIISIAVEVQKYIYFLSFEIDFFENFKFIKSFVIIMSYIFLLLLISKKFNYYSRNINFKKELNNEIFSLMKDLSIPKKKEFLEVQKQIRILKKTKTDIEKREYLSKLIALRDRLSI